MKNYCLRFFGMFMSLIFCCTIAYAQPKVEAIIIDTGRNNNSFQLINCDEPIAFSVYVANLDILSEPYNGSNLYPLPDDVPDLYFELSLGNFFNTTTHLEYFKFSHTVNGVNIYEASILLNLEGNTFVHWNSKLLMLPEGGLQQYVDYPIELYRSPGELFACNVVVDQTDHYYWTDCYGEACPDYPIYDGECTQPYPYNDGILSCQYDEGPGDEFGLGHSSQTNSPIIDEQKKSADFSVSSSDFQVSPNPFHSSLQIETIAQEAGKIDIELININGQVIQAWQETATKGVNNIGLSVVDIPSGIYFIRLSDETNNFTKKIVKF